MPAEHARTAHRLLRIFDLFASRKAPLTSREMAEALDSPKSSLTALLKIMVDERILNVDRSSNTYFPSPRMTEAVDWVVPHMFGGAAVEHVMEELRERTGETVLLTVRSDLETEVIKVVDSPQEVSLSVRPGRRMSLWDSAVGEAMLSAMPDRTLYALIRRANRQGIRPELNSHVVMRTIKRVRAEGVATGYGRVISGVGAVAAAMPFAYFGRELALSVGGPEARVRDNESSLRTALLGAIGLLAEETEKVC